MEIFMTGFFVGFGLQVIVSLLGWGIRSAFKLFEIE